MPTCIVCELQNKSISIEHIVPESFGNKFYALQKGEICDTCNNLFSRFEGKALSNSVFAIERARLGIKTKKGKPVKGSVAGLEIEGDNMFRKNLVLVKGTNKENFKNYDSSTRTGQLYVKSFDKSESAVSKFLLKVGIESIYKSRKKVYSKYCFDELREYLLNKSNKDWPFITKNGMITPSVSIPSFYEKHKLNKLNCKLRYTEVSKKTLLFNFIFGGVSMSINLCDRDLGWISSLKNATIYPEHFNKKIKPKTS